MWNALWIFIGGGLGSVARWGCSGLIATAIGETFPWGTLLVNVSGCFVIGLFNTVTGTEGRWLAPVPFRQFFMWGVCGGYTTFSSFSLQTLELVEHGQWLKAGANVVLSVAVCLLSVWLGHLLGSTFNASPG
jgi:CrcB protein